MITTSARTPAPRVEDQPAQSRGPPAIGPNLPSKPEPPSSSRGVALWRGGGEPESGWGLYPRSGSIFEKFYLPSPFCEGSGCMSIAGLRNTVGLGALPRPCSPSLLLILRPEMWEFPPTSRPFSRTSRALRFPLTTNPCSKLTMEFSSPLRFPPTNPLIYLTDQFFIQAGISKRKPRAT